MCGRAETARRRKPGRAYRIERQFAVLDDPEDTAARAVAAREVVDAHASGVLVALRGAGTNPVLAWLRKMDSLRQALAA